MHVYKEKQFLIFDLGDSIVKYDFSTHTPIGKSGKPVKDLRTQLRGVTMQDVIKSCDDKNYANFLSFASRCEQFELTNIGSILERTLELSRFEQIFSAGIEHVGKLTFSINEIPSGLIRICRKFDVTLTDDLVRNYKIDPNLFHYAFNEKFDSLTTKDLEYLFSTRTYFGEWELVRAINRYSLEPKALLHYFDRLLTFEAIRGVVFLLREYQDYCRMMYAISHKFDRYPRHFLTTHQIAVRNYNRLKEEFDKEGFVNRINPEMEYKYKDFVFMYPKTIEDIKDEAVQQNNCVASYIRRVIEGKCDILFLRDVTKPDKSLVTIEVCNGKIVQARRHYNYQITDKQQEAVDAWNKWYANKIAA